MVNCSLFCPTPSLSAMLVNRFKMREDILSFNLGGMGCSAGVIAIGLAQRLLKTEPEKYALVVSTENITQVMFQPALGPCCPCPRLQPCRLQCGHLWAASFEKHLVKKIPGKRALGDVQEHICRACTA